MKEQSSVGNAYVRAEHLAWRKVGDETVVLDLRHKQMYALNPTASFFWHALDGTLSSIDLLRLSGADEVQGMKSGLDRFFEELLDLGLVKNGPRSDVRKSGVIPDPPEEISLPEIVWREEMRVAVGISCSFFPGQAGLCDQAPSS